MIQTYFWEHSIASWLIYVLVPAVSNCFFQTPHRCQRNRWQFGLLIPVTYLFVTNDTQHQRLILCHFCMILFFLLMSFLWYLTGIHSGSQKCLLAKLNILKKNLIERGEFLEKFKVASKMRWTWAAEKPRIWSTNNLKSEIFCHFPT